MLKPWKIAVFVVGVNLVLLLLMIFFPKEGIQLNDNIKLSFVQADDFFKHKIKEVEEINELTEAYTLEELSNDTLVAQDVDSNLLNEKIELTSVQKIVHPSDFENGMYAFYKALDKIKTEKKRVRILHFGDSQIEGDRISGVVRNSLQSVFGGCGVGYLPITESNHGRRCVLKKAGGWSRWQMFGKKETSAHKKYGFTGYYHQIASAGKDTTGGVQKAWIKLRPNKRYFSKAQKFEELSVLYGNSDYRCSYELSSDSGLIANGDLLAAKSVTKKTWQMNGFKKGKINLTFDSKASPDIYGISMDCRTGIALDNVALRGSSGTEFTKINKANLKAQLRDQNVGLIIYQFGVNVIPGNLKDYSFYERTMYRQLKLLKEILPNASILVVGVSDMCKKDGTDYVSYPSVAKVRAAQMNAAKKAGCAFWDLYSVMGGENSMVSWVTNEPSLAEMDFTHFNARGAKLVGNKLFNSIIADYNDFKANEIQ